MTLEDGYYLSIYSFQSEIAHLFDLYTRHDQNMALWRKTGRDIRLVRYWEFERLTGLKHHGLSFYDPAHLTAFIDHHLAELGLGFDDLRDVWGTPGLGRSNADLLSGLPDGLSLHGMSHLYSGLFCDTDLFRSQTILGLAVDGGPDFVLDPRSRLKNYYPGAVSENGRMTVFAICSPAPFWALLRSRRSMAEGSLMALASANRTRARLALPAPPMMRTAKEVAQGGLWLNTLLNRIEAVSEADAPAQFHDLDPRFSFEDNKTSAMAKLVQALSDSVMRRNVRHAMTQCAFDPGAAWLSLSGGFALNCPATSTLVAEFGFRGVLQSPPVNDAGISLGLGLMMFHKHQPDFRFRLDHGYYGRPAVAQATPSLADTLRRDGLAPYVVSEAVLAPDAAVEDLVAGPVVHLCGPAEIGPRALGARSLLADPRSAATLDLLNRIKQRQWWRPVAPMVTEEDAPDWFEMDRPSPYMLQLFRIKPSRAKDIPAVAHLDGTARVQTVSRAQNPWLHALLTAFKARTGVPILCNTSLNDAGEPIIDSLSEAVHFALNKGLSVVHVDGKRIVLDGSARWTDQGPRPRDGLALALHPARQSDVARARVNPTGLTRASLRLLFTLPEMLNADLADPLRAARLKRLADRIAKLQQNDFAVDFVQDWYDEHDARLRTILEPDHDHHHHRTNA